MRHRFTLITTRLICLASCVPAWAQATAEEEAPKSYVMSYFIVGLGITLGLVAVCRQSKRSKVVRRPE